MKLRYPQKKGLTEKEGGVLEVALPGRGEMTYLREGRVCLGDQGKGKLHRLTIR